MAATPKGFRSTYARLVDGRFGIAVFCNRGDAVPTGQADAIIGLLGGRMPPIVTPPSPLPEANGRFFSDELQSEYRLEAVDARLTVNRVRVGSFAGSATPLAMRRLIDGSYVTDDGRSRIIFDADGRGFLLDSWRARGIRFVRIDQPAS